MKEKRSKTAIEKKRQNEKDVITQMIAIYCKGQHHALKDKRLCENCQRLVEYVIKKSDCCPFMAEKTFCSNCKVHCYAPEQREQIRAVMRYAAPRMMLHRPIMAMYHLYCSRHEKRIIEKG